MERPIKRSKVRILIGVIFFRLKCYYYWYFSGINFARNSNGRLPIKVFEHKSFLRRKLKNVDLWLQENKIINLKIAIKKLDKLVINPGQTFSFWRQIGKPTKEKGYVEGMVLRNGKVITGIGGGLCQLSNLLFWITLHTPLTVVERWRHGYDVFPDVKRDQPFGSGATCSYPNIDLQIKNNTNQQFQLFLEVNDEYLVGKWFSDKPLEFKYEIFEKEHEIKQEFFGGYSRNNKIFRKVINKNTNKEVYEDFIAENHALMMYEPLISAKVDKDFT